MLLVCVALQGCGSTVQVASNWSDFPVVIDGRVDEWSSSLSPMKDMPVLLGMRNDQEYLYLSLASSDRDFRRQMMGAGMTIWFEPQGGDKIGIHYPLGMSGVGMWPGTGFGQPGGEMPPEGTPLDAGPPEPGMGSAKNENLPDVLKELEILGPGKDDVDRIPVLQVHGIEVKIGLSEQTVLYELKIPLKKTQNHAYVLVSDFGSKVDVSFETGKLTRFAGGPGGMGPRPGGMGPPGGGGEGGGPPAGGLPDRGGMGGGRRGGRGGEGGPGGESAEPKQFKLKTEVTLASGQATNLTK
jgi:hypothetical protein